jgi:hypothetical protein
MPVRLPTDSRIESEEESVSFDGAEAWADGRCLRLPTASEYDAMVQYAQSRRLDHGDSPELAPTDDLFGGLPEWTTTMYEFPGSIGNVNSVAQLKKMHVLKGYGDLSTVQGVERMLDGTVVARADAMSPLIGCRAVHSGAPRFAAP